MTRDSFAPAIIGAVIAGFLILLYGVSSAIGASFNSVLRSAGLLISVTAPIVAIYWFLRDEDFGWIIGSTWSIFAWPCIWPVITSVANDGRDDESYFHPWHTSILDSGWLKWGVEFVLLGLLAFAIYRRRVRRWY